MFNLTKIYTKLVSLVASLILCVALTGEAYAVPAYPHPVKMTQADGSTVTVQLHGDEFFNWGTTEEGYAVAKRDGYYYYANLNLSGKLDISSQRVLVDGRKRMPTSTITKPQIAAAAAQISKSKRSSSDKSASGFPSQGDVKSVVILVEYYDVKFTVENPNVAFTNQLNQEGYSVAGATGSARDYFFDNSGGEFRGEFDVYGPYELSQPQRYYGGNSSSGSDLRAAEMIEEAVRLADRDGVDFSQYDLNDDGVIDNVFVYYAGRSEAAGGGADCVWPHKWNVPNKPYFDGKQLDVYACTAELRGSAAEEPIISGIGTFCHEFSHVFGLADHYDTTGSGDGMSYGLGTYDIMTNGSYNNDGNTPPLLNALERMMIGWAEPEELNVVGDITLAPINDGKVYKMSTDTEGEIFLFENRNRAHSVWDTYIPGEGLFITHVDQSEPYQKAWAANAPNGDPNHECFRFIPASNIIPDQYDNWDKIAYPYGSTPWNTNAEWSPNSTPKAASWSRAVMPYQLTNIARSGENITFSLSESVIDPISGTVKSSYGDYISGASIELVSADGASTYKATTNDLGVMLFADALISDGEYTITVTAEGYASYSETFKLYQGIIKDITLFSIEQGTMRELKHHNGEYSHSIGAWDQIRPTVIFRAEDLKEHIGCSIKEVRFFATAAFEGQVIIQPGIMGSGWSPGRVYVTDADLGWRTVDFTGTNMGRDITIEPNTDYYVKIMLITPTDVNPAIGMDTSTDSSLYTFSSILDISGASPQTIYEAFELDGNLMVSLALSENSMYVAPTSFKPNPAYAEGIDIAINETFPLAWGVVPANGNSACTWTSSNPEIVSVSGSGKLFGVGKGSATVTGTSVLDPSVKMELKVNVALKEARAKGRIVEFNTDNGVSDITLKFYPIAATAPQSAPAASEVAKLRTKGTAALSAPNFERIKANASEDTTEEQPAYIETISDLDGNYQIAGLTTGNKYKIVLDQNSYTDPWTSRSQVTYSALTAFDESDPEGSVNDLGKFDLFKNKVYGTERFAYWEGERHALCTGDENQPILYAIRIPASELTEMIGYELTHSDAYVDMLADPYMESVIFSCADGSTELVLEGGTSFGEFENIPINGYHLFEYINQEPIIIRPNRDYYVGLKMMGQMCMQADPENKHDGYSNLMLVGDRFVSLNDIGFPFYADWHMSAYFRDREIDPVTSIEVKPVDAEATPNVNVPYALQATISPSTATYKEIVWSSSDKSIATIDQAGNITFLKDGAVTFTAQSEKYSDVKCEYDVDVELRQGTEGYVIDSDGNSVANAKITYYATAATQSVAGSMTRTTYERTSARGVSVTSNETGDFYIDLEPGVYEVEAKRDGLIDYQGVITIKYGMNYSSLMMYQYVETLSEFMSYSVPSVDGSLGDESYNFLPYTLWTSEDMESQVGKQITRIKALVIGAANVRFVVFTPELDRFMYRSPIIEVGENTLEMVTHDIPVEYYINIEEGQDYCIGYEVADYEEGAAPAVISAGAPTVAGKSDCVVYRNTATTLTELYDQECGSWVIGFYVQDAEQVKGLDITVGQHDAVASWNPAMYDSFRLTYGVDGAAPTTVELTDCKYEFSGLELATKYNIKVEAQVSKDDYIEIVSSSFTTLDQHTNIPLVMLKAYDGYEAGAVLNLKTLNTEPTDNVEWFVNSEKLPRNMLILEKGKHKIQGRVTRGSQVFVTTRYINVE